MKAKIIAIGNEILKGEILDTNSRFLSERLKGFGIETALHVAIPDDLPEIVRHLKEKLSGIKLVLVTGGLGPTDDDVTRPAFAKAFGKKLIENKDGARQIKNFLRARGRKVSPMALSQARIPSGFNTLRNRWGTAPGFYAKKGGTLYIAMPGVPYELTNMFDCEATPLIRKSFGKQAPETTVIFKMFGIPESQVNEKVREIKSPEGISIGFYPKFPEVHLEISFKKGKAGPKGIDAYLKTLQDMFSPFLFEVGERKIEEKLVDALIKNQLTLSCAESCTGGLLASMLVNVSGSSACFERGVVTYSNRSKEELLGVKKETLMQHGAVSKECAVEMASGIRKISGTDIGISATGISGPGGGTKDKPVGTTHIAISTKDFENSWSFLFRRERNQNRLLTVYELFARLLKLINEGKIA